MKLYLQVEYNLDEEEMEVLKTLNLSKKEDIINFVSERLDVEDLDHHLTNLRIIDMDFE